MRLPEVEEHSLAVQCDWRDRLGEEGGTAWVSYKTAGRAGEQDTLVAGGAGSLISRAELFRAELLPCGGLQVEHCSTGVVTTFLAAGTEHAALRGGAAVTGLAASAGGLGLAGGGNAVTVWDTESGQGRRKLQGHLADIYTVRLFPSGLVALTAGADMQLRIWNLQTGSCPVVLSGHTRAITDTAIIDRGKNVISVGKDGTARLWSCGEQRCLAALYSGQQELNCCSLAPALQTEWAGEVTAASPDQDPAEVGSVGQLLAVGGEEGVAVVCVAGRAVLHWASTPSPVTATAWLGGRVWAGCLDGKLLSIGRGGRVEGEASSSPVLALSAVGPACLAVARQDGSVTLHGPAGRTIGLSGPDTEPVYSLATDASHLYTGCRDGLVRRYSLATINQILKL